jgi:hypothetical protein
MIAVVYGVHLVPLRRKLAGTATTAAHDNARHPISRRQNPSGQSMASIIS